MIKVIDVAYPILQVPSLNNKTKLNGDFKFQSNNYIHNYETNIYDRVNTNNLIFSSLFK